MIWTSEKLFYEVIERLRDVGEYPESLLEYAHAANAELVDTHHVSCFGTLCAGSSEGIYVDIYLDGDKEIRLGTFKCLQYNHRAWMTMGWLMANFQWYCDKFIYEHMEELC